MILIMLMHTKNRSVKGKEGSMIPFIRSLPELMLITQAYNHSIKNNFEKKHENNKRRRDSLKHKKIINLPDLPKIKRKRWIKSKKAVLRILDELDYNNQIQSTYDLTLIDSQKHYDNQDIA